jgi:hypothetical protein
MGGASDYELNALELGSAYSSKLFWVSGNLYVILRTSISSIYNPSGRMREMYIGSVKEDIFLINFETIELIYALLQSFDGRIA